MHPYNHNFFQKRRENASSSARVVVPLVLEFVRPRTVIDVGCGEGAWLSVFRDCGVRDVLGIDGDYVDQSSLEIPPECFRARDLRQPLNIEGKFDLVVSLEVAEHLPPACADAFVQSLTALGPVILFSAAIPLQGGTDHLNEQWPEYWIERFEMAGFVAVDCLRRRLWLNESVAWWYAQNMFLFVSRSRLDSFPKLKREYESRGLSPASMVHPRAYMGRVDELMRQQETSRRLHQSAQELAALIPSGERLVLVDENQWEAWAVPAGRHAIPFLEREGQYWGPPGDDDTAISELKRLHHAGANFIVFGWPAFWWLDYYKELHKYLRANFLCVVENDRIIAFDLRS